VSENPYALKPIEPILVFDLSKFAFIEGLDAVSTLDHRPDIMQMGHGEFEHLVRHVFEAMGMQGWNHIRELAGAMEEKKAGRGILVTTSWFTAGGRQKAHEHGRMQLVDGQNLTFLIKKYVGKEVVISVKRPKNAASIDQPDLPEG
jgi:restriction system protein